MSKPINLMGLDLKNPVITAAGPWARDGKSIQRCIDAGAGAVITETITLEAKQRVSPRLFVDGYRMFNTMLYSDLHLEQWECELEQVKKRDSKLICSIWGSSASEIAYLAAKAERMGADAIEISISAPIGSRNESVCNHSSDIRTFVRAAVDAVSIPVMVKLSYEAAVSPAFLQAIEQAGAKAVSAIDAIKGLRGVDIETHMAQMSTYGGYTGRNIRPISLATTAQLRQYTQMQICSVGGIQTAEHALEFIMLGATAIQLASAIQRDGYGVIEKLIRDLDDWLARHGHTEIEQVRGSALPSLMPFEDIKPKRLKAMITERCDSATTDCNICMNGCLYDAISRADGVIVIDSAACEGCGLCSSGCPRGIIQLGW
ncbi:MAG: 4Fe-4S binding protein [Christensenella sp.]|nr:4Fe-4S binding protein [Christensenella sp.]